MRIKFNSLLYKTNRFHVAVGLFSNRSQKTSKCGKNIIDTLGYRLMCHFICDLLLNRRTATWNLFVKWNHSPVTDYNSYSCMIKRPSGTLLKVNKSDEIKLFGHLLEKAFVIS